MRAGGWGGELARKGKKRGGGRGMEERVDRCGQEYELVRKWGPPKGELGLPSKTIGGQTHGNSGPIRLVKGLDPRSILRYLTGPNQASRALNQSKADR